MINLLQGDCLDILPKLAESGFKADAVIADPPYGTTQCRWDSVIEFDAMWAALQKVLKPKGVVLLFGSEPFASRLRLSNLRWFKYDLYWQKPSPVGFLNAKKQVLRNIETISVFSDGQGTYNPQLTHGHERKVVNRVFKINTPLYGEMNAETSYDSTDRYPTQLLVFSKDTNRSALHPTQKPVALMEYLIRTFTNEGEMVLDFCMGSGSTGVAALNTNRRFVGIEKEARFFQVAEARINGFGV